jgi:hypothetical protein
MERKSIGAQLVRLGLEEPAFQPGRDAGAALKGQTPAEKLAAVRPPAAA